MKIQKKIGYTPIFIDLHEIKEKPGPYTMSFGFDLKPLIRAIENFDLINIPFVIRNQEDGMDVVTGYRRLMALKSLQWDKAPCIDLSDSGLSPLELLLFNLYDNLPTRRFNDVEKGMILKRLLTYLPKKEVCERYGRLFGITRHEDVDMFVKIEELDKKIKDAIAKGRLSLKTTGAILEMKGGLQPTLFMWILILRLNFNQQNQFIEYISDISNIDNKSIPEILAEEQFVKILEDRRSNNPQKARKLLDLLRTRRNPLLTRSEKTFKRNIAGLDLPVGVSIKHPPFFETPDYRLEILFRNGRELKEKIDSLSQIEGLETVGDPWQQDQ